jgi:hypothetical protein
LVGRSHECDYPLSVQNLPVCTTARLDTNKSSLKIDTDVQTLLALSAGSPASYPDRDRSRDESRRD